MDRVAVLIPCFNEEKTIKKVIKDFQKSLPDARIYVYDNNSTDKTAIIAKKAGAIVRHERSQGKGNVVRRMFQEIVAECYILVDGDDTYPAESAPKMVESVLGCKQDMVIGDRLTSTYFEENKRPFHNFGNNIVRFGINLIFRQDIKDIMTGYRAFSFRFVKTFPIISKGFEIETEMTIHSAVMNLSIENVVIEYRDRPEGSESKLNTISDGVKVILTIVRLFKNYKPLLFFSLIASIILISDLLVLGFVVIAPFIETGLVEKLPTLIVGGVAGIIAILLFCVGIILNSIWQKERREFEFRLILVENLLNRE